MTLLESSTLVDIDLDLRESEPKLCTICELDLDTLEADDKCGKPAVASMICRFCGALLGYICKEHLDKLDEQRSHPPAVKFTFRTACCDREVVLNEAEVIVPL